MAFDPDKIVVRGGNILVAPAAFPLAAPARASVSAPQVAAVSRTEMNTLDLGALEALRLTIQDELGKPRAGLKVSIARPEIDFSVEVTTGGDGSVAVEDLEPGSYRVSFEGSLRWLPTVSSKGGKAIPVYVKTQTQTDSTVEQEIRKDLEAEHLALIQIEKEESAHA